MRKNFPIVEVCWVDAHSDLSEISIKEAARNDSVLTYSIGYLIAKNEHGLSLVTDQWPQYPNSGNIPHFIPWGIITDWWELVHD